MRRAVEKLEQFAVDVILERRFGRRAAVLRWVLQGLSSLYLAAVNVRLWMYARRLNRQHALGCMVISIGNLTVGGTGKTPVVEMFARALQAGGRRVAILSRGYKSKQPPLLRRLALALSGSRSADPPRVVSDGTSILLDSRHAGDEPFMLARNLHDVAVLVDKNRAKSGSYAIRKFGADILLLDDGLQHLKLRHRLDVVLIDRTAPFGNGHLLPRGTLREPPQSLRRANYIFITKCNGENLAPLIERIRRHNRVAEIVQCAHAPVHLRDVWSGQIEPLQWLKERRIGAVSAIARPESFEEGLLALGAKIELSRTFEDHHRFSEREIRAFFDRCLRRGLDAVVTTEKDAVRFPRMRDAGLPVLFLRVQIEILDGGDIWERCIQRICNPPAPRYEKLFH